MAKVVDTPEYSIRESKRARRLTIKVSSWAGVEVVVPPRFNRSEIRKFIQSKAGWIKKSLEQIGPVKELQKPDTIYLGLLGETWQVEYSPSQDNRLGVSETDANVLLLTGPVEGPVDVAAALNQWLQKRAKTILDPWLHQLSSELSLPFSRASVRRQRTKWGSCSAEKSISLNRNLLFLSEAMVRYVLVHELCHVRQLNHSDKFWRLLETFEPNARETAASIRKESKLVPRWAMA
ncbi:MAG: M48 family metallopeptidase [SAR202 cluster bacterium]|nr:M48 family metallopeptidase [SAR202 cluster bacterium]